MFQAPAIGIELGDGALKAVAVERRGAKLVVTFAEYRPYAREEDGAARPSAGLERRAYEALQKFLAEHPPSPLARIFVGVPSIASFNRLVRVPRLGTDQMKSLADYELHRSLRGDVDDYQIRNHVVETEEVGTEVPCMLFAIRTRIRDAFVSDLTRAGLEFDMLVPSPVALAQFARYDRPFKGDRIVVSVGLRATEVIWQRENAFCFRTLPLGVVGLLAIDAKDTTKRETAARRLVRKICYEIGAGSSFHFSEDQHWNPTAVALFGEGANLPEIVAQFERHYGEKIEAIGHLHRISLAPDVSSEHRKEVPMMGSALGLAIQAARADHADIQLVEPNRARAAARRVPLLAMISLAIFATCAVLTWRDVREARSAANLGQLDLAEEIRDRRAAGEAELREFQTESQLSDALSRLLRGRAPRSRLLNAMLRQFGPKVDVFGDVDVRLRRLEIQRTSDGAEVTGVAQVAEGDAMQSAFVLRRRLENNPSFDKPQVEVETTPEGQPARLVLVAKARVR